MSGINPIVVTHGSCIDIEFVFKDEAGSVEDVTDDTFGILRASSPALQQAVFTKTEPEQGKVHFFLAAEHAIELLIGNVNWFRLQRTFADGCQDNTDAIWINVK